VLLPPTEFLKSGEQQAQKDIINLKVLVQFPGSLTIHNFIHGIKRLWYLRQICD